MPVPEHIEIGQTVRATYVCPTTEQVFDNLDEYDESIIDSLKSVPTLEKC